MIVLAPGWPLWNLAAHLPWLTSPVIRLTEACVIATVLLLAWAWLRPRGLRCLLAVIAGLVLLELAVHAIAAVSFVARPFAAYHFVPLYPHAPNTSFPSLTTACFAMIAVPVAITWRRLGWVAIAIAAEVGFGCVYVGVHYVTDVVAGVGLGAACGAGAWLALGYPPVARLLDRADGRLRRAHLRRAHPRAGQGQSVSEAADGQPGRTGSR